MFSSISNLSPKKLLASYLCKSLAEFFMVDKERVETNLIHNAKVVLNQIEIKQRRVGGLLVSGSVTQIEFSWAWDTAALITDVKLTIKGISIDVKILEMDANESLLPESNLSTTESNKEDESNERAPSDWKAKYLQQIIDHLTLVVTDAQISIYLNDDSQVVLEAKKMELETLQNDENLSETLLMQTASLASIEAWMISNVGGSTTKYPILEPFGYHARVQRISGRRFLDGVLSGLFVHGKAWNSENDSHACSTIRVHACVQQATSLIQLQQVLLSIGLQNDEIETNYKVSFQNEGGGNETVSSTADMKSVFCLPFASMEVVLENNVNIRLADCVIHYCTDGTELRLESTGGIWIDDVPLSKNARWALDMVSSELVLDSLRPQSMGEAPPSDAVVEGSEIFYNAQSIIDSDSTTGDMSLVRLDLNLQMFQKLYQGIQAIFPQCQEVSALAEQTMEVVQSGKSSSTPTSPPWTMRSPKTVSFRFTGASDIWVQVSTDTPKMAQRPHESKSPFAFDCGSIVIDSNAGFSMNIPELRTENKSIFVKDRIVAMLQSKETATVLQSMWADIMEIINYEAPKSSFESSVGISFAGVDFTISDPTPSSMKMSNLNAIGAHWKLDLLQIDGVGGISSQARSLELILKENNNYKLLVQEITNLSFQENDYLRAPLFGTELVIENDTLSLSCNDVGIDCPELVADLEQKQTESPGSNLLDLPFNKFHLTIKTLAVKSHAKSIDAETIGIWLRPSVESSLEVSFQRMKALFDSKTRISCGTFQSSLHFLQGESEEEHRRQLVTLPGLGRLSTASMSIHDIAELALPTVGQLSKPTDVVNVSLEESLATVNCDTLMFCCPDLDFGASNSGAGVESTSFGLPLSVCLDVKRLVLMSEFGPGKPGVCFDKLRVKLSSDRENISMNAVCNYVQGRGPDKAELVMKGVRLDASKLLKSGTPLFGLQDLSISISEISILTIPQILSLSKPILNPRLQLKNGMVDATFGLIHLKYLKSTTEEGKGGTTENREISFPFPFCVVVQQVIVDKPAVDLIKKRSVQLDHLLLEYTTASQPVLNSLRLKSSLVDAKVDAGSFKVKGIAASANWNRPIGGTDAGGISIPYLGVLRFVSVEIESFLEISTESFSLFEPIQMAKMSFHDNFLSFDLSEIQVDITKGLGSERPNRTNGKINPTLMLDMPVRCKLNKCRLVSFAETSCFDINIENVGIDYRPKASGAYSTVLVQCSRFTESTRLDANGMSLNLSISNCTNNSQPKNSSMSFEIPSVVQKAYMKAEEISHLQVLGRGRLSRPLLNSTLSYENQVMSIDIGSIHCESLDLESSSGVPPEKSISAATDPKVLLHFPVDLSIKHMLFESNKEVGNSRISLEEAKLAVSPPRDGSKGSLTVRCKSLESVTSSNRVVVAGLNGDVHLEKFHPTNVSNMSVPALGVIFEGTVNIESLSRLEISGVGHLGKEIKDSTIVYGKDGFLASFGRIEWFYSSYSAPTGRSSSTVDHNLFKFPIQIVVQSLDVKDPETGQLSCNELNACLHSDPFEKSLQFMFQMDSLTGSGFDGRSVAASGTSLTTSIILSPPEVVAISESVPTHAAAANISTPDVSDQISIPVISLANPDSTSGSDQFLPIPGIGHISSAKLGFSEISELSVPSLAFLRKSAKSVAFRLDQAGISVHCPSICIQKYAQRNPESKKKQSNTPFDLRYKVNISIHEFQVLETLWPNQARREINCGCFELSLEPVFARIGTSAESPGAGVYFRCANFRSAEDSTTIVIPRLSVSCLVQLDELSKLGNLVVGIEKAQIAADFSSVNWSGSLEKEPSKVMKLPFAVVPKFDLTLKYVGTLVNINNATIHCDAFEGDKVTTLELVGAHYAEIVRGRIPYLLIAKTEIAGANLGDSVGMMAGAVLTSTSVLGSTVGVAGRDAVGSTLNQGKASRGASATEGYKFGDFTRGVVSSAKSAARRGSEMRGGDVYKVGDWSTGTTKAAGEYASENRVRLAGAGGSTAGMIAGAALLGPVGFVAGSFLGASAAQSSMRAIAGDPKRELKENGEPQTASNSTPHQAPDLLSSNTQAQRNLGSNRHERASRNPQTIAPPDTNAEAELLGEVATSDYRAVMVQAQVMDPLRAGNARGATNAFQTTASSPAAPVVCPTGHQTLYHSQQNAGQGQNLMQPAAQRHSSSTAATVYNPVANSRPRPSMTHHSGQPGQNSTYQASAGVQNSTYQAPAGVIGSHTSIRQQPHQYHQPPQARNQAPENSCQQNSNSQEYHFGDVTRGIVARGRQRDGRDPNSGYKFGDFTRGLFR